MATKPTKITLKKIAKTLEISFDDGQRFNLPAELLRVESPSAEVQGHSENQKKVIFGRREVKILKVEPVGNYAIRIFFDDLHDTGIFSWKYLYTLGFEKENRWNSYLKTLEHKGLSRDP